MSETTAEQSYTLSHLLDGRWSAEGRARDRKFWGGLVAALLLHSLLLIAVNASKPRAIGDPSGAEDAFSVDLITEADLNSRSAVADTAGNAPGPPAPPPQAPSPPQPQAEPPPEAKVDPKPDVPPEPAAEPAVAAKSVPEPVPEPKEAIKPSVAEDIPDVMKLQEAGIASEQKTAEPKPEEPQTEKLPEALADPLPEKLPETPPVKAPEKPAAKPAQKPAEKKTAKLDLSMPAPAFAAPPSTAGGAAGVERPPGITRSGANDDFARGVIRALQRTMPQLSNTRGRVTVRIVLNDTGNLADVKVLRPSDISGLDQSVMFATRQSSYPLPPPNSKDVDRIFVVTYIYR